MVISEEARQFIERIEKHRSGSEPIAPANLAKLFNARELDSILNADEAAAIASAIAGRRISSDYIKRIRLDGRLRAKKINERAYVYLLRDLIFVEYRKSYTRKPTGRPKKRGNEFSDNVENSSEIA